MSKQNLSQQRQIFDGDFAKPVTVIGVGAVGSQVAMMLAKLGVPKITVYDEDVIESHNIAASMVYGLDDLGFYKVNVLADHILKHTGIKIKAINNMYTRRKPLTNTVVACVDTMEARKLIWKKVKKNPNVDILVDTRVAKELISVFAINPCDKEDIAFYENFLYPTSEAHRPTCGRHGISFVAATAAAVVCGNLTNWWQYSKKKQQHKELCVGLECFD